MKTTIAIRGADPSGLALAHALQRRGIGVSRLREGSGRGRDLPHARN